MQIKDNGRSRTQLNIVLPKSSQFVFEVTYYKYIDIKNGAEKTSSINLVCVTYHTEIKQLNLYEQ